MIIKCIDNQSVTFYFHFQFINDNFLCLINFQTHILIIKGIDLTSLNFQITHAIIVGHQSVKEFP